MIARKKVKLERSTAGEISQGIARDVRSGAQGPSFNIEEQQWALDLERSAAGAAASEPDDVSCSSGRSASPTHSQSSLAAASFLARGDEPTMSPSPSAYGNRHLFDEDDVSFQGRPMLVDEEDDAEQDLNSWLDKAGTADVDSYEQNEDPDIPEWCEYEDAIFQGIGDDVGDGYMLEDDPPDFDQRPTSLVPESPRSPSPPPSLSVSVNEDSKDAIAAILASVDHGQAERLRRAKTGRSRSAVAGSQSSASSHRSNVVSRPVERPQHDALLIDDSYEHAASLSVSRRPLAGPPLGVDRMEEEADFSLEDLDRVRQETRRAATRLTGVAPSRPLRPPRSSPKMSSKVVQEQAALLDSFSSASRDSCSLASSSSQKVSSGWPSLPSSSYSSSDRPASSRSSFPSSDMSSPPNSSLAPSDRSVPFRSLISSGTAQSVKREPDVVPRWPVPPTPELKHVQPTLQACMTSVTVPVTVKSVLSSSFVCPPSDLHEPSLPVAPSSDPQSPPSTPLERPSSPPVPAPSSPYQSETPSSKAVDLPDAGSVCAALALKKTYLGDRDQSHLGLSLRDAVGFVQDLATAYDFILAESSQTARLVQKQNFLDRSTVWEPFSSGLFASRCPRLAEEKQRVTAALVKRKEVIKIVRHAQTRDPQFYIAIPPEERRTRSLVFYKQFAQTVLGCACDGVPRISLSSEAFAQLEGGAAGALSYAIVLAPGHDDGDIFASTNVEERLEDTEDYLSYTFASDGENSRTRSRSRSIYDDLVFYEHELAYARSALAHLESSAMVSPSYSFITLPVQRQGLTLLSDGWSRRLKCQLSERPLCGIIPSPLSLCQPRPAQRTRRTTLSTRQAIKHRSSQRSLLSQRTITTSTCETDHQASHKLTDTQIESRTSSSQRA